MKSDVIFYQVENGPIKCAMGDFAYALMFAAHNPYALAEYDYHGCCYHHRKHAA